jgi:hypothetical protein
MKRERISYCHATTLIEFMLALLISSFLLLMLNHLFFSVENTVKRIHSRLLLQYRREFAFALFHQELRKVGDDVSEDEIKILDKNDKELPFFIQKEMKPHTKAIEVRYFSSKTGNVPAYEEDFFYIGGGKTPGLFEKKISEPSQELIPGVRDLQGTFFKSSGGFQGSLLKISLLLDSMNSSFKKKEDAENWTAWFLVGKEQKSSLGKE